MNACFYQTKGGVGKTTLAYSVAKYLNYKFITNDSSTAILKLNGTMFTKDIPLRDNTIYDFGGFKSEYIENILNQIDLIIIPVINDANSVLRALEALKKVQNKKHILVANMIENEKDLIDIKKVIYYHFPKTEIVSIRKTKLFKNAMEENLSITEYIKNSNIGHLFKSGLEDFNNLLKKIENILQK